MLTVTLLGSAATRPLPERALSAAVFSVNGRHILLDCGEGTQTALHRHRISPMKLDLIALTHYHGDHILGLPGLLQTMDTMDRREPLHITGPEAGHEAVMDAILALAGELSFPVWFTPMKPEGLTLHNIEPQWPPQAQLLAFPTAHRVPSQGYRLEVERMRALDPAKATELGIPRRLWRTLQWGVPLKLGEQTIFPNDVCGPWRKGLSVVFTGDTAASPRVQAAALAADLLIMDATYPDDSHLDKAALYGHATFPQAAELAHNAGVQRLWLTHYSAMIEAPEAYLPAAQAAFPGAECGFDGKAIALTFR